MDRFTNQLAPDSGKGAALRDIMLMLDKVKTNSEIIPLALDKHHSEKWDEDDAEVFQEKVGQDIVNYYHTGNSLGIIVSNDAEHPILLMHYSKAGGWEGVNIDKRLRHQIGTQLPIKKEACYDHNR